MKAKIAARVKAEGRTPRAEVDDIHALDSMALGIGWELFWRTPPGERERLAATWILDRDIDFVISHWPQHGDAIVPELSGPPSENPFKDFFKK